MQDDLSHVQYGLRFLLKLKYILLFFLLLIFGVFTVFPLKDFIDQSIRRSLSQNPNCAITYEDLQYSFFPPGVKLKNTYIPPSCSQNNLKPLSLPLTRLSFSGFSFSPIGVAFSLETNVSSMPLKGKAIVGFSTHAIRLNHINLEISEFLKLLREAPYKVRGNLHINGKFLFSNQSIQEGALRVEGKELTLPSQTIKGFEIPFMELGPLDLIAEVQKGSPDYQIKRLSLGESSSAIRLKGEGKITVQGRMDQSKMDIKLELAPSEKLMEDFMILETLLQSYNQKDGFYRLSLKGSLSFPKVGSF